MGHRGAPVSRWRKLLEGEGGWWRWRSLGLQVPHELLVALARLERCAALGQGGKGAGAPFCLFPVQPKEDQGHLRETDSHRAGPHWDRSQPGQGMGLSHSQIRAGPGPGGGASLGLREEPSGGGASLGQDLGRNHSKGRAWTWGQSQLG